MKKNELILLVVLIAFIVVGALLSFDRIQKSPEDSYEYTNYNDESNEEFSNHCKILRGGDHPLDATRKICIGDIYCECDIRVNDELYTKCVKKSFGLFCPLGCYSVRVNNLRHACRAAACLARTRVEDLCCALPACIPSSEPPHISNETYNNETCCKSKVVLLKCVPDYGYDPLFDPCMPKRNKSSQAQD